MRRCVAGLMPRRCRCSSPSGWASSPSCSAAAARDCRSTAAGPWRLPGAGPWVSTSPEMASHPAQVYEGLWMLIGIPVVLLVAGKRHEPVRVNHWVAWADRRHAKAPFLPAPWAGSCWAGWWSAIPGATTHRRRPERRTDAGVIADARPGRVRAFTIGPPQRSGGWRRPTPCACRPILRHEKRPWSTDHPPRSTSPMTQTADPVPIETAPAGSRVWAASPTGSAGGIVEGNSGRRGPVYDPATGRQAKWVDFASAEEVDAAVAAAAAAFPAWRATSLSRRTEIMFKHPQPGGSAPQGARRDPDRGARQGSFRRTRRDRPRPREPGVRDAASRTCSRVATREQVSGGIDVYQIRQPLGVVAGITPFNFPAMVPMWMFANAIACGNTFILKPSEKDPSRVALHGRAAARGRRARTASSTSSTATRSRSIAILEHPHDQGRLVRRLDAHRASTSTRPALATASASRRWAAPRTT